MYGGNLYLLAITQKNLGKKGASMYAMTRQVTPGPSRTSPLFRKIFTMRRPLAGGQFLISLYFFPVSDMTTFRMLFPLLLCGSAMSFSASAMEPGTAVSSSPVAAPAPHSAAPSLPTPKLAPLTLTQQFSGPLQDTAIQRFIDPETGVVCYLYTPYAVPNSRNERGQLVYGANNIGNISCVAPWKK
jgi:hypothetical protein